LELCHLRVRVGEFGIECSGFGLLRGEELIALGHLLLGLISLGLEARDLGLEIIALALGLGELIFEALLPAAGFVKLALGSAAGGMILQAWGFPALNAVAAVAILGPLSISWLRRSTLSNRPFGPSEVNSSPA